MATDVSALQEELREDPYPLYRVLRESGRAHWSELPRGWLIPHHSDVVAVLRDPRLGVDRRVRSDSRCPHDRASILDKQHDQTLFFMDPPAHTRLRERVRHAFTPRRVEALRPRIQAIAEELLEAAASRGRLELIADFAYPLPVRVIAELLGIPADDLPLLRRWSDDLAVLLVEPFKDEDADARCEASLTEMRTYFEAVFSERRSAPRDDLVSELVGAEPADALDDDELFGLVSLVLVAGHETTTNLIGNSVLALLRNPEARRFLAVDPSRTADAVDELLRFESPVQVAQRIALEDCEVAGQRVRRGDRLYPLLGSANRDPEAFPEPDRLDFRRGEVRHVAFGSGRHFCLGAALARLEGAVALETLMRRLPSFKADFEKPVWRQRLVLRGLETLPLRF